MLRQYSPFLLLNFSKQGDLSRCISCYRFVLNYKYKALSSINSDIGDINKHRAISILLAVELIILMLGPIAIIGLMHVRISQFQTFRFIDLWIKGIITWSLSIGENP